MFKNAPVHNLLAKVNHTSVYSRGGWAIKIFQHVQLIKILILIMYYYIKFAPSMEGYLSHPCKIVLVKVCHITAHRIMEDTQVTKKLFTYHLSWNHYLLVWFIDNIYTGMCIRILSIAMYRHECRIKEIVRIWLHTVLPHLKEIYSSILTQCSNYLNWLIKHSGYSFDFIATHIQKLEVIEGIRLLLSQKVSEGLDRL